VNRFVSTLLAAFLALLTGCGSQPATTASATNSAQAAKTNETSETTYFLSHAQENLPRIKLFVGAETMSAEVCSRVEQVATGLMHRKGIGPEEGMLFVFAEPRERSFYMKNVDFDIAVAYIDADGVINEIVQLKARDEKGVPSKSENIQFVLETAPDYFSRHGFGPGTLIVSERGPMKEALSRFAQVR